MYTVCVAFYLCFPSLHEICCEVRNQPSKSGSKEICQLQLSSALFCINQSYIFISYKPIKAAENTFFNHCVFINLEMLINKRCVGFLLLSFFFNKSCKSFTKTSMLIRLPLSERHPLSKLHTSKKIYRRKLHMCLCQISSILL